MNSVLSIAPLDHRYVPDPDLIPIVFDDAWIEQLRSTLPETALVKRGR